MWSVPLEICSVNLLLTQVSGVESPSSLARYNLFARALIFAFDQHQQQQMKPSVPLV